MSEQKEQSWAPELLYEQFSFVFFSFGKVSEQLEQKHLHLLQILDSERQGKWHYVQQTEELAIVYVFQI